MVIVLVVDHDYEEMNDGGDLARAELFKQLVRVLFCCETINGHSVLSLSGVSQEFVERRRFPVAFASQRRLLAKGSRSRSSSSILSDSVNSSASVAPTTIFAAGDRTEINLTDAASNGRSYGIANPCGSHPNTVDAGRGASFLSKDGSSLIFVADSGVLEHVPTTYGRAGSATVSGNLYFPNGLNYRIDNSNVTWIRDRNGNKIQIQYSGPLLPMNWDLSVPAPTQVIDSLGRTTSINYNDASCGGCTSVTYPGVGGALRAVHNGLTNLSKGLLRSGYSISVMGSLFPEGFQTTSNFDPVLASYVQFADGSQYQFQYNNYGELARVTVPTGGAIEYDYGDGSNGKTDGWQGGTVSDLNAVMIYGRLQERREYAAGGDGQYTSRSRLRVIRYRA